MTFQDHPVQDQAHGLRAMFAHSRTRFVPLVSNPHLVSGAALLETLAAAIGELGLATLVVDAGEHAPEPDELARLDLAGGIEPLAPGLSYLAARGLPLSHVDAQGSSAGFLHAIAEAAPDAVMHAYAAMKLLAMRAGLMAHDLLLTATTRSPRADRIAEQMARCADAYSGAALHDWVRIDPAQGSPTPRSNSA